MATRYDKLALTYSGGAVLRAVSIRQAVLGDTPQEPWGNLMGLAGTYGVATGVFVAADVAIVVLADPPQA